MFRPRRHGLLLALSVASLAQPAAAQDSPIEAFLEGRVQVGDATYPYRLLAPEKLVEGERYPLVLFLHGAGERGDDNARQLGHFPELMAEPARRAGRPCFVLAPQCPRGSRWSEVDWGAAESTPIAAEPSQPLRGALAALAEVVREHPVDLERLYLTGLSMGGYGTWDLAARHPGWFAAAVPICGGGDERVIARLAGLPLSVWHGDADRTVPLARSRVMVEALGAVGGSVQYHELEGVGHDAWIAAYGPEGCLDWLFETRRDPRAELDAAARLFAQAWSFQY